MHTLSNAIQAFEEAVNKTDKIYFAIDIDAGNFLYLNSAFVQLWRRPIEEVVAKPISLLDNVDAEDREYLIQTYREVLNGESKKTIEFRIHTPEGIKWLSLQPLLIKKANNRIIVGSVDNFTAAKEYRMLLEKYAAKKDSVLEILSHDLAGPLTTIKGASALISDEIKPYDNPALDNLLDLIKRTTARSIHLIREFVKQEFLESANVAYTKKRVNIVQKIKDSIDEYKGSEKEINKTFEFKTSDSKIFMEVDDYKFLQVINNLMSNALKFTPDGGTISINIEEMPEHVLFTVADNGVGIPAKFHDSLFEKFNDARRPGLKGEPSVGLGMSLIKTIVDWHKGKIWFESKENEGTTFYIELPKE